MKRIALRSFEDADTPMFTEWLHQDYVLKWYEDPDSWLLEINGRNDEFTWIHHFIVMAEETPIGFCQYYDCRDAGDMEDWYCVTKPGDTYSIDYMIGNQAYLGKGYGKEIVALLADKIREAGQARRIIVQPDKENHASNHVLLANGFVFDKEHDYFIKELTNDRR